MRALLRWYARNGRSQLPWRKTRDPYRVLVSECMLQQTQVSRVLPKYRAFVKRFPTLKALAAASRADVVREWRGLGYNSRAMRLHAFAQTVRDQHAGRIPSDERTLLLLPGIGPYTAAAIRAFAFDMHSAAVDTNIRRILHRLLHGTRRPTGAAVVEQFAGALIPRGRAHDWNSAMMDLGAMICTARAPKCDQCPMRSSCAAGGMQRSMLSRRAAKQNAAPFHETSRFARGRIVDRLRELPPGKSMSLLALERDLAWIGRSRSELRQLLEKLAAEGLLEIHNGQVALSA